MKNVTMAIAATMVLIVIATGVAGAEKEEKPAVSGIRPVILPDATWTDNIWTVGSSGFFFQEKYSGTTYGDRWASVSILAGDTNYFEGPLTVPSTVKGKPCYVSKIYILWASDPTVHLHSGTAYSGTSLLKTVTRDVPGSLNTVTTISLGGNYRVAHGLLDDFLFENTDSSAHSVFVYAYGAQIKHAA
jgi:hypothetical protein